jgi:dolichyl-phosphate-mannose-protein mannosyltransferase
MARAVCLIVLPCIIYTFFFAIHFDMLPETGSGTNFMSSEFQTSLKDVQFPEKTPAGK